MYHSRNLQTQINGPLIAMNFRYSEDDIHANLAQIAKRYDVTNITEKQKTSMSKELFEQKVINAIEHAILSLPNQRIDALLSNQPDRQNQLNLIDIYEDKVIKSMHQTNLSPEKAIDDKFLFIMKNLHQQHENS